MKTGKTFAAFCFFAFLAPLYSMVCRAEEKSISVETRYTNVTLRRAAGQDEFVTIGDVHPGEEIKIRVALANRSSEELVFEKMSISCKCLDGTVLDKTIPSGGTGVADFRFVADKKPRSSSDSVSATLFFKDAGVQSLRFVANYKNSISFPFTSVDINHSKGQEIDRTIPLFVTKDVVLSDCKVKCTGDVPFLSVAMEKIDGNPVVRLRSKVSELERAEYTGKIDLYLNDELVDECRVRLLRREANRLSPSTLVFTRTEQPGVLEASAVFRMDLDQNASEPMIRSFTFRQIDATGGGFRSSYMRIGRGTYRVSINVGKQDVQQGDLEWTVDFSTAHSSIVGVSKVFVSN
ncbi:MAG: hypothetical protein ACK57V_25660 [Pirellula sp.]|jgi:hypothetical protein